VIAHGVIYAAHQLELQLPQDISIVGIGDFAGSAEIVPALTTVRLPANRIGQLAADALVNMSEQGNVREFNSQLIDTQLIVRDSTTNCI